MTDRLTDHQLAEYDELLQRTTPLGAATAAPGMAAALLDEVRRLRAALARRVQCGDCGAVGSVDTAEDGRAYLYPSGQIGH